MEKAFKKEVRCVLGPTIAAADSIKNRKTTLHTLFNQLENYRRSLVHL